MKKGDHKKGTKKIGEKGDHKKVAKKIGENGGDPYPRLHPRQLLPHTGLHRSSALLRGLPLQVLNVIDIFISSSLQ